MELTKDWLLDNGYTLKNPDCALPKFGKYGENGTYCIIVESEYHPQTNILGWCIHCWKEGKYHEIARRVSLSYADTVEELEACLKLCQLNVD